MKKTTKRCICAIIALCLLSGISLTAFANESTERFNPEQFIYEELNDYAKENGIGVIFENILITPIYDNISDKEIEQSTRTYVEMMKKALSEKTSTIVYEPSKLRTIRNYTASVESMIPAIGWGYIKQDFKADVTSSKVSKVSLIGSSYDTGFTIGTWEPNYSWYAISKNQLYLQIYMKGSINYLWDALNITQACIFEETYKGNGTRLDEVSYMEWPD